MCNYTVGINCLDNLTTMKEDNALVVVTGTFTHALICWNTCLNVIALNLHTVGADFIMNAPSSFALCRYIQAVRRLKAEGRKLLRTVHLMFVPGRTFDGFLYSLLFKVMIYAQAFVGYCAWLSQASDLCLIEYSLHSPGGSFATFVEIPFSQKMPSQSWSDTAVCSLRVWSFTWGCNAL